MQRLTSTPDSTVWQSTAPDTPELRLQRLAAGLPAARQEALARIDAGLSDAEARQAEASGTMQSALAALTDAQQRYEAYLTGTVLPAYQAQLDAQGLPPGSVPTPTLDQLRQMYSFEQFAPGVQAAYDEAQLAFESAEEDVVKLRQTYTADREKAGADEQARYKRAESDYKAWLKYKQDVKSAEAYNKKNAHNYNALNDQWDQYEAELAQWKVDQAQLAADIAAGKYRVQNPWKAFLSGDLTEEEKAYILSEIEKGNLHPDLRVPEAAPAPVAPKQPRPDEPPAPVTVAPLNLSPEAASLLGLPTSFAGVTSESVPPVAARTPAAVPTPTTTLTEPAPTPGGAPRSAPTSSTGSSASGSTSTATQTTGTTATPPTTPPPAPPPPAGTGTGTAGAEGGTAGGTQEGAGSPAAEAPPGSGESEDQGRGTGSETAGEADEKTDNDEPQTQDAAGVGRINPQGTTNEVMAPNAITASSSQPQGTPAALANMTSGAALQPQSTGTMGGQVTGQAGQQTDQDDEDKGREPQATPKILAPFQKPQDVGREPDSQNAWV